ncbi:hypothetical protein [Microbacterium sp.]|uniref:hypothetical protein n=1 Tax=Microbacterium sp. TaxID=51671 RepID=UPI003F6F2139
MNLPKQLINAIGAIVVVVVLAAGAGLVAYPFFAQATATSLEAANVAMGNATYRTQVDVLRDAEANLDETEADLAALRTEIPADANLDEVFELVANAAATTGVTVVSVTAQDPLSYAPRDAAAEAPATTDPAATEPDPAVTPDASTDGTVVADGTETETQPEVVDRLAQIPLTIEVTALDPAAAEAFLDQLQAGPRLLAVLHTVLGPADGALRLTVDALAFSLGEG